MRATPVTQPRRRPRQARAQATVDAIVKATALVLVEEGYDRASTNRIAHAAGVSIGSLYQYFPSKESLVAALIETHSAKMIEALSANFDATAVSRGLPLDTRTMVAGMISAYRIDPRLHHVLCQEVPKVGELCKVYGFEDYLSDMSRKYLASFRDVTRIGDLDRTTFLLIHAVPSVIRAAVQSDPTGASDSRLADELTDLILRYIMVTPPS